MIPFSRQFIDKSDVKSVAHSLKSNFLTQGPKVQIFEKNILKILKAKYAVATNSGSSALHIACLSIGLKKGDTIFVNPEFFRFGILKEAKNKRIFFNIYLNVIKKIIGATGTIAVNTYTFNTLRDKQTFIYEKSISTSSEFSEFVRKQRGSIRSNHPVFSVTALGKNRKKI